MITSSEIKALCAQAPNFDDIACGLNATKKNPRGMVAETRKVVAIARKFKQEVMQPYTLELDRRM